MTVQATVDSTLNGQSADLILIEDGESRSYEQKALSGGTETFVFTGLDGGLDKEYTAKIVPSTSDVTQTAEIQYGAEVQIDPIPHRDTDAANQIRETAEFNNGVAANNLGLGDKPLINGLLTSALNDGEVLADDGYVYSTVQAAQDAASSWIFVGPGTFNEAVTIDTAGLTVQGTGYNTHIDGGTTGDAVTINASDVSVYAMSVSTTSGGGNSASAIDTDTSADSALVTDVTVRECDYRAVQFVNGSGHTAQNVTVTDADNDGFFVGTVETVVNNCTVKSSGRHGVAMANDDCIANNNVLLSVSTDGINISGNDCVAGGNRINAAGDDGAQISGNDNILYNNRISDSATSNIDDNGSGTVLDSNNTGASN